TYDAHSPRADAAQDIAAREARAAMLNRRLETRLATLHTEIEQARAAGDRDRQQALEHDLTILEAQLTARRNWETTSRVSHRP
ncbi:MAG TPA: hypothetical protein VIV60_30215, partial [Polyangiaceae bacterium]